jgi:hypothetical protein
LVAVQAVEARSRDFFRESKLEGEIMAEIQKPIITGTVAPTTFLAPWWESQQEAQQTDVVGQATGTSGLGIIGISFDASNVGRLGMGTTGTEGSSLEILPPAAGVVGSSSNGFGVFGLSNSGAVFKESVSLEASVLSSGVMGLNSSTGSGVTGVSKNGYGVYATSYNNYAIYALGNGQKPAVHVEGDVEVTGDVTLTGGMDCAEQFDVAGEQELEPGTVVVIDQEGALRESYEAYDRRVAGVVSGAGDYKPAIVLGRRATNGASIQVALVGKVYCKVDAEYAPIVIGDILTASPTSGHAMKAIDRDRAFGAVIGKAMRPLESGRGLIPMLVALQ